MMSRNQVHIVEVGPRDGLQNITRAVPTATKVELIQRLIACGLQTIELTSAVSPKAIPQLADSSEVLRSEQIQQLLQLASHRLPVLVPNLKGLELVTKHGVKEIAVFVSASEGFSKRNNNCSVVEGLSRARAVAQASIKCGMEVRGYVLVDDS
jgi:hydroxymethylglutaryl-CoA lyase